MDNLNKLNREIKKNGFVYELIKREEQKAMYKQTKDGKTIAYEVFKVKKRKNRPFFNEPEGFYEAFPSNEDFGKTAWTTNDIKRAIEIYNSL